MCVLIDRRGAHPSPKPPPVKQRQTQMNDDNNIGGENYHNEQSDNGSRVAIATATNKKSRSDNIIKPEGGMSYTTIKMNEPKADNHVNNAVYRVSLAYN